VAPPPTLGAVVTASVRVPTTLTKVLNIDDVTVSVTATAVKVFNGPPACVLALSKTASPAIDMTGNLSFTGKKCALHANSSATGAMQIGGSASVKADGYCAVGTVISTASLTPKPESFCDELPDPYAGLKEPTDLACDFNKTAVNDKKKTTTLNPGVYCGGLSLQSDTVLNPGLYVIRDGSLSMNAQGSITGTGVTFYLTGNGASFDINGGAKLGRVFDEQAMDEHDTYTLRATTNGWDLRLNGERLSLFETFFEAQRTALSAAETSRGRGKIVKVYVQTASGNIDLLHKARPRAN
jgi:hypothetical protein